MAGARRENDEARRRRRAVALQRLADQKKKALQLAERRACAEERKRLSARCLVMRAGLGAWRRYVDEAVMMRDEGLDDLTTIELLKNRFAKPA